MVAKRPGPIYIYKPTVNSKSIGFTLPLYIIKNTTTKSLGFHFLCCSFLQHIKILFPWKRDKIYSNQTWTVTTCRNQCFEETEMISRDMEIHCMIRIYNRRGRDWIIIQALIWGFRCVLRHFSLQNINNTWVLMVVN